LGCSRGDRGKRERRPGSASCCCCCCCCCCCDCRRGRESGEAGREHSSSRARARARDRHRGPGGGIGGQACLALALDLLHPLLLLLLLLLQLLRLHLLPQHQDLLLGLRGYGTRQRSDPVDRFAGGRRHRSCGVGGSRRKGRPRRDGAGGGTRALHGDRGTLLGRVRRDSCGWHGRRADGRLLLVLLLKCRQLLHWTRGVRGRRSRTHVHLRLHRRHRWLMRGGLRSCTAASASRSAALLLLLL
jgi:hypothetical protein